MSESSSLSGLRSVLSMLSAIQRAAATGTLIVQGPRGGSLAFARGSLSQVAAGSGSASAEAASGGPAPRVLARALLLSAASGRDGMAFAASSPPESSKAGDINAADLILDLVTACADAPWVRREIGSGASPISPSASPPAVVPRAALSPTEGFVLSRVDGASSIDEILSLSPLGEDATLKSLYGLLAVGMLSAPGLDILDEMPNFAFSGSPAPEAGPTPASPPKRSLSALDDFLKRTHEPAAAEKAGPRAAPDPAPSPAPAVEEQRRKVLERIRECRGADHYRILGVARSSDENKIRREYYKIAKHFHPDRFRKQEFEDILAEIESMFAATTEAYNTLGDEKARAEYDRSRLEAGVRPPDADPLSVARESYLRARKHLEGGELYDALRLLETAIERDPSKPDYWLYLGIVQTKNPKWRKKAEASLLKVIAMSPMHTQACLYLARLYKEGGLARRAAEMYEKLLKWEPENEEALVELGRKKPEPAGSPKGRRSLFKK